MSKAKVIEYTTQAISTAATEVKGVERENSVPIPESTTRNKPVEHNLNSSDIFNKSK